MAIGFIRLGRIGKALAEKRVEGNKILIISNMIGVSSLTGYVAELGPLASAGIVVDANNAILADGTFVDLGEKTSSELVEAQLPGARVVKAFNSLFVAWIEDEPGQPAGKRVVFVSGEDAEAKHTVKGLISAMRFAPIDLGRLVEGGRIQPAGQPLAALNLLLTN